MRALLLVLWLLCVLPVPSLSSSRPVRASTGTSSRTAAGKGHSMSGSRNRSRKASSSPAVQPAHLEAARLSSSRKGRGKGHRGTGPDVRYDSDAGSGTQSLERENANLSKGRRAKHMRIKGRLSPHLVSPASHQRADSGVFEVADDTYIVESTRDTADILQPTDSDSPLFLLRKKLSTRAFTSFVSLLGAKWVNRLDFNGNARVLLASRMVFAIYVMSGAALLTMKQAKAKTFAASTLIDDSFSDEDISEAEKEVRELDKARRKLLLEGITYATLSFFGMANAPLLLVPAQSLMNQLLLPPDKRRKKSSSKVLVA